MCISAMETVGHPKQWTPINKPQAMDSNQQQQGPIAKMKVSLSGVRRGEDQRRWTERMRYDMCPLYEEDDFVDSTAISKGAG